MRYVFRDLGEMDCGAIVRSISSELLRRRAVNVSFDSGVMHAPQWERIRDLPITPAITEELIAQWPVSHDGFCDEWWVFDTDISDDFRVKAFCNFIGTRIDDYKELDWEGGCPLDEYLEQFRPAVVFGNNERAYVIRRA
jgi:hypothetical protein